MWLLNIALDHKIFFIIFARKREGAEDEQFASDGQKSGIETR
jgi:hypothetical protein